MNPSRASFRGAGICARLLSALVLLAISLPAPLAAQAAPHAAALDLLPSTVRPGGVFLALGSGLSPDTTYTIVADCIGGTNPTATSDSQGAFSLPLMVPEAASPTSSCVVLVEYLGHPFASASLTILPALGFTLSAASGQPGDVIHFTVTNLAAASSLRLDYAGVPVFGPLPVGGSPYPAPAPLVTYSGEFTVPADRPNPLGQATTVTAVDLLGRGPVGSTSQPFFAQTASAPLQYSFSNTQISSPFILSGGVFTVTGHISPPPDTNTHFQAIYTESPTRTLPLQSSFKLLNANGDFQMISHYPDLRLGDALALSNGSAVSVIATTGPAQTGMVQFGNLSLLNLANLNVQVFDAATHQPIEGALVQILSAPDFGFEGLHALTDPSPTDQLQAWAQANGIIPDPSFCGGSGGGGISLGWGDQLNAHDLFVFTTPAGNGLTKPQDPGRLVTNPLNYVTSPIQHALQKYMEHPASNYGAFTAPEKAGPAYVPPSNNPKSYPAFVVVVNAIDQGYGNYDDYGPYPNFAAVVIGPDGNFMDIQHQPLPNNTLVFNLNKLPADLYTVQPTLVDNQYNIVYGFGPAAGAQFFDFQPQRVYVEVLINAFGARTNVSSVTVTSPFGGSPIPLTVGDTDCVHQYQYTGSFTVDELSLWPGAYPYTIQINQKQGAPILLTGILTVLPIPAWFTDPALLVRRAFSQMSYIDLDGKSLDSSQNLQTIVGYINHYGNTTNAISAEQSYAEFISRYPSDYQPTKTTWGGIKTTVLDKITSHALPSQANAAGAQAGALARAIVQSFGQTPRAAAEADDLDIPIGPYHYTLFDSGYFPLQEFVYPTPFGDAELSLSFRYDASLDEDGFFHVDPPPPYMHLVVTPSNHTAVRGDVSVNFLFVIAEAGVTFVVNNTLSMPTTYDHSSVSTAYQWTSSGDVSVHVGVLCVCDDCIYRWDSGWENIWTTGYPRPAGPLASGATNTPPAGYRSCNPAHPDAIQPLPPMVKVAMATDGAGQLMEASPVSQNQIVTHLYDGLQLTTPMTITTGAGPRDLSVAYYDKNKAVAVWAESALPYTQDITLTHTITDIYHSYHLAYALWDGAGWGAKRNLTDPTTGDGQVSLAVCRAGQAGCPSAGEVTAVWTHDPDGSIYSRDFKIRQSIFDGGTATWSAPAQVDPNEATTASDNQPAATYAYHSPGDTLRTVFVAWVRDSDQNFNTLPDRRLAARWMGACGMQFCQAFQPAQVPSGIMEFSLNATPAGQARLALTVAENGATAYSARHTLYTAQQNCGANQLCLWSVRKTLDAHGRSIYAESPVLTVDSQGLGTISFRGLGFAPDSAHELRVFPEDALGMSTGLGDLAQVETDFTSPNMGLHYLTNDAAVNWNVSALYVPQMGQTVALAMRGLPPTLTAQQRLQLQPEAARVTAAALATSGDSFVAFAAVPRLPDFDLNDLAVSTLTPQHGQPLSLQVGVRNDALGWTASAQPLQVLATWDGDASLGRMAGATIISLLPAGQTVTVTLSLDLLDLDFNFSHTLTVSINPAQTLPELSQANNHRTITLGELPAPTGVEAMAMRGYRYVSLRWTGVDDPRRIGYRIYRAEGSAAFAPIGTSFDPVFLDVTAELGKSYRYAVSFFSANGQESPLSGYDLVQTRDLALIYAPMIWLKR